jgi:Protein of unknown function (DUF3102)
MSKANKAQKRAERKARSDLPGTHHEPLEVRQARATARGDISAIVAEMKPVAESIRELEASNVKLATATVTNVIAIAKLLGDARSNFKHGEWGSWLASEFEWSARTSARYMSVYGLTKRVPDLDQLNISVSVLYLLAELPKRFLSFEKPREMIAEIIALARTQRVTVEMAEGILHPLRRHPNGNSNEFVVKPELTPQESVRKERERAIRKEEAIGRVVLHDLTTDFGMQAFKNSLASMSICQEDKFLGVVLAVLEHYIERQRSPSRFDGDNRQDGDAEFDAPRMWRQ